MKIYERIFARLEELCMTQTELSKRTGIAVSTISDWRKKQTNPQADKLVPICKALDMSLTDLLCEENSSKSDRAMEYSFEENYMITCFRKSDIQMQRSLLRYFELLSLGEKEDKSSTDLERNVTVVRDADGNHIVLINDKRFKGLSRADWKEVENYLKSYIGECYEITYCSEKIFIDTDFPDEYANSESRIALKEPRRVAKANAAQAIPELIQIALPAEKLWQENQEKKHAKDAKFGWYRYKIRFGIPVYDNDGVLERYNIFTAIMLVRHAEDGKKYLYDFTTIKKETSSPPES